MALRSYINRELSEINRSQCEDMTQAYVASSVTVLRKLSLALSKPTIRESYDSVRDFVSRPDSMEIYCRQLSDQLTLCESCFERPILYNVVKDEAAMQNHISNHNYGGWARDSLYQMLMSAITDHTVWKWQNERD